MKTRLLISVVPLALLAAIVEVQPPTPEGKPEATINLATEDGVRLVLTGITSLEEVLAATQAGEDRLLAEGNTLLL